jgi:cell wall-associated NlpC family hydrolase
MPLATTPASWRRWACGSACALALLATPAHANLDAPLDPISRFLVDGGFVDATATPQASPEPTLVDKVRDSASDMVLSAMYFLGVRYRRGGASADTGFDCSGFTRHVFEQSLGLVLPRRVDEQATAPGLGPVKRAELKPGDLVFFNTLKRTFSHVGIYVGDGKFIHAPRTGARVRVEDMRYAYWSKRYTGARRAQTSGEAVALSSKPAASLRTERDGREVP